MVDQLKEKLSKTGVFFRADAPRSLRNPGDVYLPIFVEIINGVEQEAHTTGSGVSNLCQTRPLETPGCERFREAHRRPAPVHHGALTLG